MRPARATTVLVALVTAVLLGSWALTGCGGGDADAATDHNAADVAFVDAMIPHHQQALEMVAMTEGRDLDPEFSALAEDLRAAQQAELDLMRRWQQDWAARDADADDDGPDDPGAGGTSQDGMGMGGDLAGMMTSAQLADLARAPDGSFRRLWLQSMIEHHQGALGMAETEIAAGRAPDTVELARSIRDTQQGEVTRMQALLAG